VYLPDVQAASEELNHWTLRTWISHCEPAENCKHSIHKTIKNYCR